LTAVRDEPSGRRERPQARAAGIRHRRHGHAPGDDAGARAAIEAGASYVDFASEEAHYKRLKELDAMAHHKGLFLLTGAGVVPGFSAVLAMRGVAHLPAADSLEIIYAQGRMAVADGGLGSLMTGVLEAGLAPVMLGDGTRVPVRLGEERKRVVLPAPFGEREMPALTAPASSRAHQVTFPFPASSYLRDTRRRDRSRRVRRLAIGLGGDWFWPLALIVVAFHVLKGAFAGRR
jgi:hypothetical protein